MRRVVYLLIAVLAVLHQDFWLWDSTHLAFGFIPAGLAYHATYSIAAAVVWWLAIKYAWPDLSRLTDEDDGEEGS
jgi:hypothetical protein